MNNNWVFVRSKCGSSLCRGQDQENEILGKQNGLKKSMLRLIHYPWTGVCLSTTQSHKQIFDATVYEANSKGCGRYYYQEIRCTWAILVQK